MSFELPLPEIPWYSCIALHCLWFFWAHHCVIFSMPLHMQPPVPSLGCILRVSHLSIMVYRAWLWLVFFPGAGLCFVYGVLLVYWRKATSALCLLPIHKWHSRVVLSWLLLNYWLIVSTYSISLSQTSCAWIVYFRKVVIKMEKGSEGYWRRIQFGHMSLRYSVFCFVVLGIKPKALHMPGKWFATEPGPHPPPTSFLCRGLQEAVCGALERGGKQHLLQMWTLLESHLLFRSLNSSYEDTSSLKEARVI